MEVFIPESAFKYLQAHSSFRLVIIRVCIYHCLGILSKVDGGFALSLRSDLVHYFACILYSLLGDL